MEVDNGDGRNSTGSKDVDGNDAGSKDVDGNGVGSKDVDGNSIGSNNIDRKPIKSIKPNKEVEALFTLFKLQGIDS